MFNFTKSIVMTEIKIANSDSDYKTIAELASVIWQQHYIPIIGAGQVEYMLNKYQSKAAIKQQTIDGAQYYIIHYQESAVGYISYMKKEGVLFLSKIYILDTFRGKGIGKLAMDFIKSNAKKLGLNKIALTVNKYNTNSIKAYEKMGFDNVGEIVTDIGNGFVMDDYQLEIQFN
jgi:RimJ/RimL family protein N-acetyltransferase